MRFRIATLNVWGLPAPLSEEPFERFRALGARLPDLELDAIALQEVWTAGARRQLARAGREAGLGHAWGPTARVGDSGLLILSRWPIATAQLSPYALRGLAERFTHGDYYARKGFVSARIETPGGPLEVVATHLHARYASDVSHEYLPQRAGQIVQLALGLRDHTLPLVVLGDFNFTERHVEYGMLRGLTGLRDVARELGSPQPTVLRSNPFRGGSKPDKRVDYIFARDGGRGRVRPVAIERAFDHLLPDRPGRPLAVSDHAGLVADLELAAAEQPAPPFVPAADAVDRALEILADGREQARVRRSDERLLSAAGVGCAALVALGDRSLPPLGRRAFLRAGLRVAAGVALAPSVGCSLLSEVVVPEEIRAYDRLGAALTSFERELSRREPRRRIADLS